MSYSTPQAHLKWQVPPTDAQIESSDLDSAGSSHGGDEFEQLPLFGIPEEWEPDSARRVADARCARCSEGDDFALLISGMDDAMIAYADRVLGDDPVWSRLKAIRQAMSESL